MRYSTYASREWIGSLEAFDDRLEQGVYLVGDVGVAVHKYESGEPIGVVAAR